MMLKLFTRQSKTIAGAALLIGASAVLSRVLGLVRDRLLVGRFGVGDDLDAYYAAFQIPNVIFALLVLGTLSVAFIPVFADYIANDKEKEAWRMTSAILTVVMAGMGVICLLLIIGAPWLVRLIAPGFEGEKLALTVRLTRIMMLSPFLFSISAVFSSVLNGLKQFLAVSIAPLLYNLSLILGILFLTGPFGIAGVAYGAIFGACLHLLIQVPSAALLGMRFRFVWDLKHVGVRQVGKLFLPRVFGVDISQISLLIGSIIGTTLAAGSVALFNLSMNIGMTPVGVIAIPFAIAAFPNLSESASRGRWQEMKATFVTTCRQIMFFLVPLAALAIVLRFHILRVVIGTSNVSWDDTRLAATSFALIVVSLVFQGLSPLLARVFYAMKNTLTPVVVAGVSMSVNIATVLVSLNWLEAHRIPYGIWGMAGLSGVVDLRLLSLALGFSVASTVQVLLLLVMLRRRIGHFGGKRLLIAFGQYIAGALGAVVLAMLVIGQTSALLDVSTFIGIFLQAVLATVVGFVTYGVILALFRSEELEAIRGAFRQHLLKLKTPFGIDETHEM